MYEFFKLNECRKLKSQLENNDYTKYSKCSNAMKVNNGSNNQCIFRIDLLACFVIT